VTYVMRSWSSVYQSLYIQQADTYQFTVYYARSLFINYISEYHLPHAVKGSYTTPTRYVNWGLMSFEIDRWRHCLYYKWVSYMSEMTACVPDAELGHIARYSMTITITIWTISDVSHLREPCSEIIFRLCNLYFRSTQNADVSPINLKYT